MPRETLRALDADVERLLLAGGTAAASDDGLAARHAALVGFAARVAALGKVAEQVAKVTGAKPRAAATELLNLAATSAQLKGAQASAGSVAGELRDCPLCPPIDTPLAHHELAPLLAVATNSGSNREAVMADAVEHGRVVDLRLMRPWLAALSDGAIGAEVATSVLPKYGESIAPALEAEFKLQGGAVDGRRLLCLVAIRKSAARPLVERALAEGTPKVRGAALEALCDLDPAGVAPVARKLLATDKSAEVRSGAVAALRGAADDASLDALINALRDRNVIHVATHVLAASVHPAATERVLALLTPEALDVKPFKPSAKKAAAKKALVPKKAQEKAEQEAYQRVREAVGYLEAVFQVLGQRGGEAAEATLTRVMDTHGFGDVRVAACRGLVSVGTPTALEAVARAVEHKDTDLSEIAIEGLLEKVPGGAFDWLARYFAPELLAKKNGASIPESVLMDLCYRDREDLDPRWADVCVPALAVDALKSEAVNVLVTLGDPRIVDVLLADLANKKWRNEAIDGLGKLKEKRGVAPIAALLMLKEANDDWYSIFEALKDIDDPAAIPALSARKAVKRTDKYKLEQIDEVIRHLERDRTLT